MGLKINYNGAATNAWRNLSVNDSKLMGSVEKLSSGLRINKGADDPAGLIISERLGAQISGLGQAIQNAQEAVSLVQTAEGALTEVNTMLSKMRTLANHAANTGVNDADAIAADQQQVDSALDSIQKIAENTRFQQVKLLDGSRSFSYEGQDSKVSNVEMNGELANVADGDTVTVDIATAATKGVLTGTGFDGAHLAGKLTIKLEGSTVGTVDVAATEGNASIVSNINALGVDGLVASVVSGEINITGGYGQVLSVTSDVDGVIATSAATSTATGADVALTDLTAGSNSLGYTTSGWDITVESTSADLAGTVITLADDTGTSDQTFKVDDNRLAFALGQDASDSEYRKLGLDNVKTDQIGAVSTLVGSSLEAIRSGGTYELNGNAAEAIQIIDDAIDQISTARANLGAFQQNALETTVNTLTINKENLEASQSRIKDVDMAMEMMNFTRSQILTQAGTAMLAQANQLPQSILQLLG